MLVMKFGGASIRDAEGLRQVAAIVAREKSPRVVVLSAVYGQTNEIREFSARLANGRSDVDGFVRAVRERHERLAQGAIDDREALARALREVDARMLTLEILLYGAAYSGELTDRTFDLVQSYGERLANPLLEGALASLGVKAKGFESDRIGIATDGVHGNATADLPATAENLKRTLVPEIQKGTVPVVTGFFGSGPDGRCTTFGRNGSDYSAAVIANALDAGVLEVWKDVDGFMTADPALVPDARPIPTLSYDEAGEIAYFGSKILHPRTIEPVRPKNITVSLRNSRAPDNTATRITAQGSGRWSEMKSVSHSSELALIKVYGAGFAYTPGVVLGISRQLFDAGIGIYSVVSSQLSLSILLHSRDCEKGAALLEKAKGAVVERVELDRDVALVNVVGDGIGGIKGLPGSVFTTVANAGVSIKQISLGGSLNAINFLVSRNELERTVRGIHDRYIVKAAG
ncbi:MAG: aspartate kinase [Euryarchaeota archaeon]|nr:aspartate kinase [Euryarchaeota archaeon]